MVAMTVLGTGGPIAAFAQTANGNSGAFGGDADAESGDALAIQLIEGDIDNDVTQTSTTTQTNALSDDDAVVVTQANVPVQTQEDAVAIDIDAEGLTAAELVALIEEILGGDDTFCLENECPPPDPVELQNALGPDVL